MQSSASSKQSQAGPRRRGRHGRDDDESLDEAPQLLDDEPADIEQARRLEEEEENESVEEVEDAEEDASPVFDEGPPGHDEPHE
jgi:hypothetical protein